MAALGVPSILPSDSEGFPRDAVDKCTESAARKAFEASTNALKASISTSLFTRVSYLWIQGIVNQCNIPGPAQRDMKKLSLVTAFMADATLDAIQWNSRAIGVNVMVRRNTWLRNWDIDSVSQS